MKATPTVLMLWVAVGCFGATGQAAELKSTRVTITVARDGGGFLDSIRYRGRQIVRSPDGFVGAAVELASAGDGTPGSLFANRSTATLRAVIADVRVQASGMAVRGSYTDGKRAVPFTRQIDLLGDRDAIAVKEEADFRSLDPAGLLARYALHLPLVVHKDPHLRMFGFGGAHRAELFRMDMNDITRRGKQLISASRGHWPYWDIAGVLQLPHSYRIWRANHADTMAYPIEEGAGAPGWADYSELDWGVTVVVQAPDKAAPWAVTIDARKGVLSVAPHPASQMAVSGRDLGRRVFSFTLRLHETSWPATYPCELDFPLYEKLLKDIIRGRDRPQPYVLYGPLGTADIATIIHKERIQPSTVLRTLYRGDAWRMRGRMKTIGRDGPRNQPLAKWEAEAKAYLDHIRKHGLPQAKGK